MRVTRKRYSLLLLLTCIVSVISLWTSMKSVGLRIPDDDPLDTRNNRDILKEGKSKELAADGINNATDIKKLQVNHMSKDPVLPWLQKLNYESNITNFNKDERTLRDSMRFKPNEVQTLRDPPRLKPNDDQALRDPTNFKPKGGATLYNCTKLLQNRKIKPISRKAGIDLMRNIFRSSRKLPNATRQHNDFYSNVSNILASPWCHDPHNAELLRFIYENVTRTNAHDDTMLTQKNKGRRVAATVNIPKQSLLPKPPYKSCSVVGNSRVLLGSKCAKLIDEKDFVFRSTLSSIAGPEEDVGKKTNMTTLNSSLKRYAIRVPNDPTSLTLVKANSKHFQQNNMFWKQLGLTKLPTTGFYLLNCALDLCLDVHVFGFWPFTTYLDGRNIPPSYYTTIKSSQSHDVFYELRLILTMHKLGVLKFHDECTT